MSQIVSHLYSHYHIDHHATTKPFTFLRLFVIAFSVGHTEALGEPAVRRRRGVLGLRRTAPPAARAVTCLYTC